MNNGEISSEYSSPFKQEENGMIICNQEDKILANIARVVENRMKGNEAITLKLDSNLGESVTALSVPVLMRSFLRRQAVI